jgi:hypothetical protein
VVFSAELKAGSKTKGKREAVMDKGEPFKITADYVPKVRTSA